MDKQKKMKDEQARKLHQEGLRKSYEERMIRKAKREGRKGDDLLYYLKIGLDPPTITYINEMKSSNLSEKLKMDDWKEKYSQHCYSFHFNTCTRDRRCAYLHSDAIIIRSNDENCNNIPIADNEHYG